MTKSNNARWILVLTVAAAVVNGLLAGGNVDRALIAMPAWRAVGMAPWADFSRNADLGRGQLVYPVLAIGGTLLSLGAAFFLGRPRGRPREARWFVGVAALLMLVSLPVSFRAAPFMLSLRHLDDTNLVGLRQAFAGFEFWGRWQGILHVLAFGANLGGMIALARGPHGHDAPTPVEGTHIDEC